MSDPDLFKKNEISIAAIVVTFNPDERLIRSISSLVQVVNYILLVDNNSKNNDVLAHVKQDLNNSKYEIIFLDSNRGIAGALNYGIQYILNKYNFTYILTMDQDTILNTKNLSVFINEANKRWKNVGLIALGSDGTSKKHQLRVEKYAITSGNLISTVVLAKIKFREEFFMDQVDFDFDYNLRSLGYIIILVEGYLLDHRLGTRDGIFSHETPVRIYYMIRNSTVLLKEKKLPLYKYIIQLLSWLPSSLIEFGVIEYYKIFKKAIRDALSGNLGPNNKDF